MPLVNYIKILMSLLSTDLSILLYLLYLSTTMQIDRQTSVVSLGILLNLRETLCAYECHEHLEFCSALSQLILVRLMIM